MKGTVRGTRAAAVVAALLSGVTRGETPPDPLRFTKGEWTVTLSATGGLAPVGESRAFWNVIEGLEPSSGYDPNRLWAEYWLLPGVAAEFRPRSSGTFYGGVTAAVTGNLGRDLYDAPPGGRASLEKLFLGWRLKDEASGISVDLSAGQQDYSVGTGFLVFQGAENGGARGATYSAPRTAWEMTGLARLAWGKLSAEGFFLRYNTIPGDPETDLLGGRLEVRWGRDAAVGVAYLDAISSTQGYLQAPETVIPDGRKGTKTWHAWGSAAPLPKKAPSLTLSGELALQRNARIDMTAWAAAATAAYAALGTWGTPTLSYTFAFYSGDDPATAAFEAFDPLFWNPGLTNWASGGNGAYGWINSNIVMHRVRLNLVLSPADTLDLLFFSLSAARTNSPLGYGRYLVDSITGELPGLGAGVPTPHLNDDVVLQWTRTLGPHWSVTPAVGISFPGAGLDAISNGTARTWVGASASLSFSY